MQKIEKILGLRAEVHESLPALLLSELGDEAFRIAKDNNLHLDEYHVYRHRLEFTEQKTRFLKNVSLAERIHSVVVSPEPP